MNRRNVGAGLGLRKVAGLIGVGLMVMGTVMSIVDEAGAIHISSNFATALTIRVTPNVDRGVEISSGDVLVNLGSVDVNFSTKTVNPATVTIMGNMSSTELTMISTVTATTGGNASWTFDDLPLTGETDVLAAWAFFSGVDITSAPIDNEFVAFNATMTTTMGQATQEEVGDATSRFEGLYTGSDMDSLAAGTRRHLWIRLRTPSAFSANVGEQNVHFKLRVAAPN